MMLPPFEPLPPELLCYILSKLDGRSLACAAKVCQRWHGVVHILEQAFNIWYRCCLKEFGLDAVVAQTGLTQLLTKPGLSQAESRREDWEFWKDIYAQNQNCDCVGRENWAVNAEELQKPPGLVTAIAFSPASKTRNGMMWMGFRSGEIYGSSLNKNWLSQLQKTDFYSGHINGCTDMSALQLGGCHAYRAANFEPEVFVISSGLEGCVKISDSHGQLKASLQPRHHQTYSVSVLGAYFVVGHDSCLTQGLVIYKIVATAETEKSFGTPLMIVPIIRLTGLLHSSVKAVALTHNQVVAGDDHGVLYTWTMPSLSNFEGITGEARGNSNTSADSSVITVNEPARTVQLGGTVEQILLHRGQSIAFSCMGQGIIYVINNDNWSNMAVIKEEKIIELARNGSHVTCLATSGSLLAVGCRSGEVLLFRITSKDWPGNLTKNLISCFSSNMLNLMTLKFSNDKHGTVLLAAGSSLNLFIWRRMKLEKKITQ